MPMSPALRTDPTRRACRPSWRGGCRPARSKHSLGATQLPSSKARIQTQVGLTPNAVLPAAARGRFKVVSLISRTQPGPSTSSMLGPGGAQSVPPAWMPVRHTALWLTLRPVIKHCAEMTQQSTCPPKGTMTPRELLLRQRELGEVPDPESTSRSILHSSNKSPPGPPPRARPRAQHWGVKCEQGGWAGPGDREARAHLAPSLVAFTWENQALLPLTGEKSDAWGLQTLPTPSVHGPTAESVPPALTMGSTCVGGSF